MKQECNKEMFTRLVVHNIKCLPNGGCWNVQYSKVGIGSPTQRWVLTNSLLLPSHIFDGRTQWRCIQARSAKYHPPNGGSNGV